MAIEAIIFDLGRVLVDLDYPAVVQAFTSCCSISPAEFERVIGDANLAQRYECGQMTTRQFYEHLTSVGNLNMPHDAFLDAWASMLVPGLMISEHLLRSLKRRFPLILLSNTNEAHIRHLAATTDILSYFDHKVLSYEIGAMKPDRRIYERTIEVSGKHPEQLFFTDDRPENIQGALDVGIRAHRFVSEQGLIDALLDAGIEIDREPAVTHLR
jgi:putative hydrolase of the HAD superfamily